MTGWTDALLGDVITLKRGYDLPKSTRQEGPVPIVSSSGPTGFHNVPKADPPGVVTGRYGTLGKVFYVDVPYWPLNTTLYVRDFNGSHERFVGYFLESMGLDRYDGAAAVPGLDRNVLHGLVVRWPGRPIQERVAAVLAAYDELIENNGRRIEILEEMTQAVYREWFVNFRFPGHEDVAMVDSPLGPIPEDWEARKFRTIADEVKDGVDPSTVDADVRYVGLEHIPQESFTLTRWGLAADVASRKWRFRAGDVLFGKLRPYFHKVVEAGFEGICSTDAIVIRPVAGFGDLALQVAYSKEFVAHAVATSGGTDRPRAKWGDLANFDVVVPDASIRAVFSRSVRPMVDLAANLAHQNANLRTTRDFLLPKLVSGEIDVSDLDIDAEWLSP